MSNKATCFFCYSWDNEEFFDILVFLKNTIEQTSKRVKVVLDRISYKYNDDIEQSLKRINEYDLIVPFFTPELFSLVEYDHECERIVYEEYKIIKQRFHDDNDSIFPVILTGTVETSLPSIFQKHICPIINDFSLQKNEDGTIVVPQQKRSLFEKFIKDLIGQALVNSQKYSIEYSTEREALEKLFYLNNTTKLPPSCLIKMSAYQDILEQKCCFVVGRKGSGKSTFLKNLSNIAPDTFNRSYKKLAPICADNLNLDHIYRVVSKYKADKIEIPLEHIIVLFWEVLFVLHSIYVVGIEEEDGRIEDVNRANGFHMVSNKLKELLALKTSSGEYLSFKRDGVLRQLSVSAIDFIDDYFPVALQQSNVDNLVASVLGKLTTTNIINFKFGSDLLDTLLYNLDQCERKIIISIDGFDKESETFRRITQSLDKDSTEYIDRLNFEITFYSQLLELVCDYKFETFYDTIKNVIKERLAFCIVLPKDRYDQIIQIDRDSAKKHFCSLSWDEYELMQLITCRLEYLIRKNNGGGYNFPKFNSLKDRFYYALSTYCPKVPDKVYINVDGNKFSLDLFNYVLRLSFWRPRDIITHFSKIIPYFKNEDNEDIDIKNEILKLTLKRGARDIIKNEFIKEYENVFINLEEVLHTFDGMNLIMDASDFVEVLSKVRFNTTFSYDLSKIQNKLYVLYQLGVIGLYFDERSFKKNGYNNRLCYIYNEGLEPIDKFIQKQDFYMSNPKIIFNTIFLEYLSLNVNSTDLIGNFDWEYIKLIHAVKPMIPRI